MRGEDVRAVSYVESTSGTSPRAWRNGPKFAINPRHNETSPHAWRKPAYRDTVTY